MMIHGLLPFGSPRVVHLWALRKTYPGMDVVGAGDGGPHRFGLILQVGFSHVTPVGEIRREPQVRQRFQEGQRSGSRVAEPAPMRLVNNLHASFCSNGGGSLQNSLILRESEKVFPA